MRDYTAESIAMLRTLVGIPSPSLGEAEAAAFISGTFAGWGVDHQRFGNNIIARSSGFDPALPTLSLDAHIDTVPAAHDYTRDPFDPGEDPDVIYGLGSNDDGGSVAAMTAAFRTLMDEPLPFNLMLTLCCEEERSGPGGARSVYAPEGPLAAALPSWTIVGEPTGMKAATSERGLLVLDGLARGRSGHAARSEGVNALYIALDDIGRIRARRYERISPRMGEVKLNVTMIEAGTAHNVIPDTCRFVVDIRPTELYSPEEILSDLRSLCASELVPRSLSGRSNATPEGSPLLGPLKTLGIEEFSSPTTSDWIRIPGDCIKMGPGESSRSHRPDEYILRTEIEDAVEKYIHFIKLFNVNTLE